MLFVLLGVLPTLLLGLYLAGAWRERHRWPAWRAACFTLGVALLVVAVSPAVSHWAHHDLRGHMLQHLLLGMFAPIPLALGMPMTLLLRNLSPGGSRRVVIFLSARPMRVLTHPVTAMTLDMGGMWLLYMTPLFALSMTSDTIHVLVHVHFVLAGYLFTWAIAGPDPAPHRPGLALRLGVLLTGGGLHAVLGKVMYGYGYPRGIGASQGELEAAARWMYYGGDIAELMLALMLADLWFRRWGSSHGRRAMLRET